MSDHGFTPPAADPTIVTRWTQVLGQVRSLAILAGGIGLGGTWLKPLTGWSDAEMSGAVAAIVSIVSIGAYVGPAVWSWVEKAQTAWAVARALRQAQVDAAVATAKATLEAGRAMPVMVVVTPPGQPNEVVRISAKEIATAAPTPDGPPDPPLRAPH